MKHPHAELMKQYAEDAMTTDKPWELWEYYSKIYDKWLNLEGQPRWFTTIQYRRKQQTKKVLIKAWYNPSMSTFFFDMNDWPLPCVHVPEKDFYIEIPE